MYNFYPRIETSLFKKYISNSLFQNFYFIYSYSLWKIQRYSISPSSKTVKIVCWSQLGDICKHPGINFLVVQPSITHSFRVSRRRQIRNMWTRRIFCSCHAYVALEFETNPRSFSGAARYVTRRFWLVKASFGDIRGAIGRHHQLDLKTANK